jgi:hypothetical protein
VGISGVTLRTTIERQPPKDLRRRISLMPSTDLDDKWIQTLVKAGKMEESFLAEEKLLRGHQDKPQERKSNPAMGKEVATGSSNSKERGGTQGGGELNKGLSQRFNRPVDILNLTKAKQKERKKQIGDILRETLRTHKFQKVCLQCGKKNHTQWFCPESHPKVAAVTTTQSVHPHKRKRDEPDIKEESAPPDQKKKEAAIISMGGRIYELESELMDVDD